MQVSPTVVFRALASPSFFYSGFIEKKGISFPPAKLFAPTRPNVHSCFDRATAWGYQQTFNFFSLKLKRRRY